MLSQKMLNIIRLNQQSFVRRTSVTLSASDTIVQENNDGQEDFLNAKPYKDVPKVSAFKILSAFMDKKQKTIIIKHQHHQKMSTLKIDRNGAIQ